MEEEQKQLCDDAEDHRGTVLQSDEDAEDHSDSCHYAGVVMCQALGCGSGAL